MFTLYTAVWRLGGHSALAIAAALSLLLLWRHCQPSRFSDKSSSVLSHEDDEWQNGAWKRVKLVSDWHRHMSLENAFFLNGSRENAQRAREEAMSEARTKHNVLWPGSISTGSQCKLLRMGFATAFRAMGSRKPSVIRVTTSTGSKVGLLQMKDSQEWGHDVTQRSHDVTQWAHDVTQRSYERMTSVVSGAAHDMVHGGTGPQMRRTQETVEGRGGKQQNTEFHVQQEGREELTEGVVVNVGDGSFLQELLQSPRVTASHTFTILITQDLSLPSSQPRIELDTNANLTLKGACRNRRCVIDAGTNSALCWRYSSTWGSFSVSDLEFQNMCFNFPETTVLMRNCVFRKCRRIYFLFREESYTAHKPAVKIDSCHFIENEQPMTLDGFPPSGCISRSVFNSGSVSTTERDAALPALSITLWMSRNRAFTIVDSTFGNSSSAGGLVHNGGIRLQLLVKKNSESTQLAQHVGAFIDSRFIGGSLLDISVDTDTTNLTPTSNDNNHSTYLGSLEVLFCRTHFERPSNLSSGASPVKPNVNVTWATGQLPLMIKHCWPGASHDARDLYIRSNRPHDVVTIHNSTQTCAKCDQFTVCGPSEPHRTNQKSLWWIIAPILGALGFIVVAVAVVILIVRRRCGGIMVIRMKRSRKMGELPKDVQHLRAFSLRELRDATGNFTTIIGRGGSGVVYKATLPMSGEEVAVKSLKRGHWRTEREFMHEVGILGRISHRNLVVLRGFCHQAEQYFLVYEFALNGTLKDQLHKPERDFFLDWPTRVRIAHEVARALEFLHHLLSPPLVHRDIKPENVLLVNDFSPKVADFGLCREINTQGESLQTAAAGTVGYMAPEIYRGLRITEKVDVYSYGVLLLEIITGKRPFGKDFSLIQWVKSVAKDEESAMELADKKMMGAFDPRQLYLMTRVARRCIHCRARDRPSMYKVAQALEMIRFLNAMGPGSPIKENERMAAVRVPRDTSEDAGNITALTIHDTDNITALTIDDNDDNDNDDDDDDEVDDPHEDHNAAQNEEKDKEKGMMVTMTI